MRPAFLPLVCLLIWSASAKAQQADLTIQTRQFTQDGSRLYIDFDIPYSSEHLAYDISEVYILGALGRVEVRTFNGQRYDLYSGKSFRVSWDVLADVDLFEKPEYAQVYLKYNDATIDRLERQNQRQATSYPRTTSYPRLPETRPSSPPVYCPPRAQRRPALVPLIFRVIDRGIRTWKRD